MNAFVVIGANFGDEGKGLVTDFLCRHERTQLVVRFTGGAQAGHTVQEPGGRRVIFHHFGSGSLLGVPTYLSRFFVTNPFAWAKERAALGFQPTLFVDLDAHVTTPYDMLVNQLVEETRAEGRHGSCGVGINETIERNTASPYRLHVRDLLGDGLGSKLDAIRCEWVPTRLTQLVPGYAESLGKDERIMSASLFANFRRVCQAFATSSFLCSGLPPDPYDVVFEGAQGLLLDEGHRFFPYVTRGRTGLANVADILNGRRVDDLHVLYVTRAYLTRHGRGPFPTEDLSLSYPDETNGFNSYQEGLRFGRLDLPLMCEAIGADSKRLMEIQASQIGTGLAVTCLDQVPDPSGTLQMFSRTAGLPPVVVQSFGPTRDHVRTIADDLRPIP